MNTSWMWWPCAFNPCTGEVEATGSRELKSSMMFSIQGVPGELGLQRKILSPKYKSTNKYYTVWKSRAMLKKDYCHEILKIDV